MEEDKREMAMPVARDELVPHTFRSNDGYLSFELTRLRLRAERFIEARAARDYRRFADIAEQLRDSRAALQAARGSAVRAGVDIPFHAISTRFNLNELEEEYLLACLVPHVSQGLWDLLIAAQGNALKQYLEVGFVGGLIEPKQSLQTPRWWCESTSRLRRHDLIELHPIDGHASAGLFAHGVRAPHYLAAAVLGRASVDERLAGFCSLRDAKRAEVVLPARTKAQLHGFLDSFATGDGGADFGGRAWRLLVSGPQGSGKTSLANTVAKDLGRELFSVRLDQVGGHQNIPNLLQLAARNAEFLDAALLLIRPEQLLSIYPAMLGALTALVSRFGGLVILEPRHADELDEAFESLIDYSIDIDRAEADERAAIWLQHLPANAELETGVDLRHLASLYGLSGGQIRGAIDWARQVARRRGNDGALTLRDLEAGAKSQIRSKLNRYTEASKVHLTLKDLVLPDAPKKQVQEFLDAANVRSRVMNEWGFAKRLVTGRGLVALFTGEPGTGKTLCAEIVANELDLQLYIVSIPRVVSKWVGETEKNIAEIFSHARAQNSMLLFDEADALFSKRVKVEKSQDHFQNMEVNMLLQELERFEGIVVLTTNLEGNLDRAFERRILFKIDFPTPEEAERYRIWQLLIPELVPTDESIDFKFLASEFELTGGQIKNAIIRAAYHCCAHEGVLTGDVLERSAAQQAKEAGKLTRPLPSLY